MLFELGRGGMGRVYLGRIVAAGGFERMVAIKRTNPELSQGELSERFMNEARMTAYIHHANVVGTHQAGRDEHGHYLVCDYVEGESLAGLMSRARRHGKVPAAIVARIVVDGLAGLHAAHEAIDPAGTPLHMLHRDVSTDNLLVGRDGVTRLSDFGIAKSVLSPMLTEEGLRHGKLIYFPPEYLRTGPVDRTLDIYAMGVTLWAGLAGHEPWESKEEAQILHAILTEGLPRLSVHAPELPPAFEAVIQRACQRDPGQRYQTARQMSVALEQLEQRGTVRIASHAQVSEYVESAIGEELAARRERVRARRLELAALPHDDGALRAAPATQPPDASTTSIDKIRPETQPDRPMTEPTSKATSLEQPLAPPSSPPASAKRLAAHRWRRRWLALLAIVLAAVALGYVARRRSASPAQISPAPARTLPRAVPSRAAPREVADALQGANVQDPRGESVDASVDLTDAAPTQTSAPSPPPTRVRKRKVAPEEPRRQESPRPQPENEEPQPGISTRNPYR